MDTTNKKIVNAFGSDWDMEKTENEITILKYIILNKIWHFIEVLENYIPNENDKAQIMDFITKMNDEDFQKNVINSVIEKHEET